MGDTGGEGRSRHGRYCFSVAQTTTARQPWTGPVRPSSQHHRGCQDSYIITALHDIRACQVDHTKCLVLYYKHRIVKRGIVWPKHHYLVTH